MSVLLEAPPFELESFQETLENLVGEEDAKDHLGLVYSAAMKFAGTRNVEDTEAFSDGCLGLLKAVRTYTNDQGKFSTWATWLIESAIIDGHRQRQRQLRIPVVRMDLITPADKDQIVTHDPDDFDPNFEDHPDDTEYDKRNKRIVYEYYLRQRSMPDIGRSLNMTRQAIHLAIQRGLLLLKERFQHLAKDWS
jgi:RNA polymerase sigma factor (sigma-70 family)